MGNVPIFTRWPASADTTRLRIPLDTRGSVAFELPDPFGLPSKTVAAIFAVMAACPAHRFYVRADENRAREWYLWAATRPTTDGRAVIRPRDVLRIAAGNAGLRGRPFGPFSAWAELGDEWPLPNVTVAPPLKRNRMMEAPNG